MNKLFAFLLMIVALLTACTPTNNENDDEHVIVEDELNENEQRFVAQLNTQVDGTLASANTDIYTLTIPSDGMLSVRASSMFDNVGEIFDLDGVSLRYNDQASYYTDDFKIDDLFLEAGTYELYVIGYTDEDFGDYTLTIIFDEGIGDVQVMSPNTRVRGNLENNQIQTINFVLETGGYLYAYLESDFDSEAILLNSNTDELLFAGINQVDDLDFVMNGYYLEPGSYNIDIRGFASGEYGPYELIIDVVYGQMSSAVPLTSPSKIIDSLDTNEYHWYELELSKADGTIYTYIDASFDSFAYLLDEDGRIIASDDDSLTLMDFELLVYSLEQGTYYLVVCGYSSFDAGSYTLHISFSTQE